MRLQRELCVRPSEAVSLAKRLFGVARGGSAGVPTLEALSEVLRAEVFSRMEAKVARAFTEAAPGGVAAGKEASGLPLSRMEGVAQPIAPPGGSPASPTIEEIESLMRIPPGTSFVASLPPAALRERTLHAAAGAARAAAAAVSVGNPDAIAAATTVDIWGKLDIARARALVSFSCVRLCGCELLLVYEGARHPIRLIPFLPWTPHCRCMRLLSPSVQQQTPRWGMLPCCRSR